MSAENPIIITCITRFSLTDMKIKHQLLKGKYEFHNIQQLRSSEIQQKWMAFFYHILKSTYHSICQQKVEPERRK